MNQRKYALELIAESGLGGAKPASTPLETSSKLTSVEFDNFMNKDFSSEINAEDKKLENKAQEDLKPIVTQIGGGCLQTRRSVTGYVVKFGNALISWKSKKQETVARSLAEAKFRSMPSTVADKAVIQIAANPIFHERTKHIDIDCHFVRETIM
uniref:Uncharacterized mitochondrial protein AtMg00810-like n=1 Tax=Nicotiana tabacum TaxID=4097 RepID=A0A1S4CKM9_TOBAC|nr:PREDICTED: uncharacterized mitochondrial protein AtMg00810-like [Nicotiana tabacum]